VVVKVINVQRTIARLKIIPPLRLQFSTGVPSYPDPDSGDIAPGMAVFVPVHFRPDSL
jgi:hypothetical protein